MTDQVLLVTQKTQDQGDPRARRNAQDVLFLMNKLPARMRAIFTAVKMHDTESGSDPLGNSRRIQAQLRRAESDILSHSGRKKLVIGILKEQTDSTANFVNMRGIHAEAVDDDATFGLLEAQQSV